MSFYNPKLYSDYIAFTSLSMHSFLNKGCIKKLEKRSNPPKNPSFEQSK